MESLKVGDWVRTKEGDEGRILLIARLSAFIDIQGHEENRTRPYLLSDLIKVDPPPESEKQLRPRGHD